MASDRVELLGGKIRETPSEGALHGRLAVWLTRRLLKNAPVDVLVACERTIRLARNHWPEPDFCLFPNTLAVDEVRGPDTLLVIEIADTTVSADLTIKGPKHREYACVNTGWSISPRA